MDEEVSLGEQKEAPPDENQGMSRISESDEPPRHSRQSGEDEPPRRIVPHKEEPPIFSESRGFGSDSDDVLPTSPTNEAPGVEEIDEWSSLQREDEWLADEGWILYDNEYLGEDPYEDDEVQDAIEEKQSLEFILDRRSTYDDQQPEPFHVMEEDEGEVDEDFLPEVPSPERLPSDEEFIYDYMNIPEEPAIERMDKDATTDQATDPLVTYLEEKEVYVSTTEPRIARCPSISSFFHPQRGPLVQLYLFPGNKIISRECRLDTNIYHLKVALGRYVHVPTTHLDIRKNRNLISDDKTMQELGARPTKKIRFTVEINRRIPGHYEIRMPRDGSSIDYIPDAQRMVRVELDDGTVQWVNVTIVFPTEHKPMLGGFVDRRNNKRFLHASTGMEKEVKYYRPSQINIAVQICGTQPSLIQTREDKSQQMERKGYYVSQVQDRVIRSKPYQSYDMVSKRRQRAAIIIQKYWRRQMGKREKLRREDGLMKRIQFAEKIRMGRLEQRKQILNKEIERQENPTRLVDLELLYRAINVWRQEQEEWVNQNRWGAEKKAAFASLTDIESDLLLDLQRTKNRIDVQERENRMIRCFQKMGQPKRWLSEKSKHFISADDEGKVHVRQLQAIYVELQSPVERTPEGVQLRCDLLSRLNNITKSINTSMSQILTQLVTRELSFLRSPKCSAALLAGVRRRISSTFFFLCQDPNFNSEAIRVQKIPHDTMKLRKDMVQCKGCRRMLHRDQFTVIKGTTVTNRCLTCLNLYRTAILRIDLNLYRHMLKELRREEMGAGVVNSVTFLMDAFDLKFLVDQIWHGQSALSGIDNRYLFDSADGSRINLGHLGIVSY